MKKQLADQAFHDRRHQERMRAEAAKKAGKKKAGVRVERAAREAPAASPERSGMAGG